MKKEKEDKITIKKIEDSINPVGKVISRPIHFENIFNKKGLTLGQRAADKISLWAGSWAFILSFGVLLVFWMIVNTSWIIFGKAWDIYPFILLNLVLSCLAAIQAPIILMSQNRTSERDRMRASYDYAVNRKAEKEIRAVQKDLKIIKKALKIKY